MTIAGLRLFCGSLHLLRRRPLFGAGDSRGEQHECEHGVLMSRRYDFAVDDLHRAAPGAVRRLVTHVVIATIAGGAFIALSQLYRPKILQWATSDPTQSRARAQLVILVGATVIVGSIAALAAYVWRLAARTIREGRFPPGDFAVIRDTAILRGSAARARGELFKKLAIGIFVIGFLLAVAFARLATLR